jgi:hypothetical protein
MRPMCPTKSPVWREFGAHRTLKYSDCLMGCALAQTVSRRLPIAAAWFRSQVRSYGIIDGERGTGAGFLRILRFSLPILTPPTAPHLPLAADAVGPVVAGAPSGLGITPRSRALPGVLYNSVSNFIGHECRQSWRTT